MDIIAEITIVPIGIGVSLSKYVASVHSILEDTGLKVELHSNGTNIQGDYDVIMAALKKCHEKLHNEMDTPRVLTYMKIGSRTDKNKDMLDKAKTVRMHMEKNKSE